MRQQFAAQEIVSRICAHDMRDSQRGQHRRGTDLVQAKKMFQVSSANRRTLARKARHWKSDLNLEAAG